MDSQPSEIDQLTHKQRCYKDVLTAVLLHRGQILSGFDLSAGYSPKEAPPPAEKMFFFIFLEDAGDLF